MNNIPFRHSMVRQKIDDKTEINYNIELMKAEYADLCEKYKIPPIEVTNDYVKFGKFVKPLVKYY